MGCVKTIFIVLRWSTLLVQVIWTAMEGGARTVLVGARDSASGLVVSTIFQFVSNCMNCPFARPPLGQFSFMLTSLLFL